MSKIVNSDPRDVLGDYGSAMPAWSFLIVKAAGALAVGDAVSWGQTADDGITVMDATASDPVAGIVMDAASAAGEFIRILSHV